jgi:hypothetical protein
VATLVETLFEAGRTYADCPEAKFSALAKDCGRAAERAGDFLILAQMPDPQPAWAQQYNFEMHPAWARKFEPPAISGGESQGALRTLMRIYRETGNKKYLEPIPKTLAYLRASRLPDGRLARFYELRSNRPLYVTREYQLTYEDGDLPSHYSFKVSDQTDKIAAEYERLRKIPKEPLQTEKETRSAPAQVEVKEIIAALDARGRWVERGKLRYHGPNDDTSEVIRSAIFIRNMEKLSNYLRAFP